MPYKVLYPQLLYDYSAINYKDFCGTQYLLVTVHVILSVSEFLVDQV